MAERKVSCRECGSERVRVQAWLVWNKADQRYIPATILDEGYCNDCKAMVEVEDQVV